MIDTSIGVINNPSIHSQTIVRTMERTE